MDGIVAYVAARQARGDFSDETADKVGYVLRQWRRHAGPPPWTEEQVAAWVNDQRLRPSTRKSRLTKLRPYMAWLIRQGVIDTDPTADIAPPRIPSGQPRDLTYDEVAQLLTVCRDDRDRLMVLLAAHCGLRAGDMARIRAEDLDWHGQRLHVRAKGGRGEPTRWEPVPIEAWDALVRWIDQRRIYSGPVFRSVRYADHGALTPAHVSKIGARLFRDAGLKRAPWDGRSLHALRHTCAQHMYDRGVPISTIQRLLGHSSESTTWGYVRSDPPGVRDAIEGRRYAA